MFREAQMLADLCPNVLFDTNSSFFPRGWIMDVHERQSAALDEINATAEVRQQIFGRNFDGLFPA